MLPIYYFQKLLKGLTSISIHVNNSAANTTNQPTNQIKYVNKNTGQGGKKKYEKKIFIQENSNI